MRAFIVEDDEVVQGVLNAYLTHYGSDRHIPMQVEVLPDAQQALERLADHDDTEDVVFLDVRLPQIGGDEIYSRLMHDNPAMLERIVFITGYRDDLTMRFPGLSLNILDKPFRYQQLQAAMESVL